MQRDYHRPIVSIRVFLLRRLQARSSRSACWSCDHAAALWPSKRRGNLSCLTPTLNARRAKLTKLEQKPCLLLRTVPLRHHGGGWWPSKALEEAANRL